MTHDLESGIVNVSPEIEATPEVVAAGEAVYHRNVRQDGDAGFDVMVWANFCDMVRAPPQLRHIEVVAFA
ncbi:MAG TPA: hypothetical protein VN802_12360 [Stellaceae bacterium]|nr:hypothetical protein [Stellaceae bacterium]